MAVPSSGALTFSGIFGELEENDYNHSWDIESDLEDNDLELSSMSDGTVATINTGNASADRPDGVAPHAISEFYSYDHDIAVSYSAFWAEDWNDGAIINAGNDVSTDARTAFNSTAFEDTAKFITTLGETNQSPATVSDRPIWTTYGTPSIVSDEIRFSNTDQTYGMFCKTTDQTGNITINNVPTTQCVAWRFRFFMNTTNNKDMNFYANMNTVNHTNPAITTQAYQIQIRDSADPLSGQIMIRRRDNTTTITTLASSTAGAYTEGTTQDFVVSWHRAGTGRSSTYTWKVGMAPSGTTTANIIKNNNQVSVDDGTYHINYGSGFRAAKAMTTPSSTHYHSYDIMSAVQMDDPT